MADLGKKLRGDTFRVTKVFYSGTTAAFPLSCNVTLEGPDGTAVFTDKSGMRTGTTGEFYYYISTNSAHDLGIWAIRYEGMVDYGTWSNLPERYTDTFQLVDVN